MLRCTRIVQSRSPRRCGSLVRRRRLDAPFATASLPQLAGGAAACPHSSLNHQQQQQQWCQESPASCLVYNENERLRSQQQQRQQQRCFSSFVMPPSLDPTAFLSQLPAIYDRSRGISPHCHNHMSIHRRYRSVYVSKHNKSMHVTAKDIIENCESNGIISNSSDYRQTAKHVVLRECPLCTKPTHDKADNLWKCYICSSTGAYFCHRCGSSGSWFDWKLKLSPGNQLGATVDPSGHVYSHRGAKPGGGAGGRPSSNAWQSSSRRSAEDAEHDSYSYPPRGQSSSRSRSNPNRSAPLPMPSPRLQALYIDQLFHHNHNDSNPVLGYLTEERGLSTAALRKYGVGRGTYQFPDKDGTWRPAECVTFPWIMSVAHLEEQEQLRGAKFEWEPPEDNEDSSNLMTDAGETTATERLQQIKASTFLTRRLKVRAIEQKAWQRMDPPGGGWGLFGYHTVPADCKEIVLTEGEYDAMAVWQATGRPAVSLPNGCRSLPVEVLPLLENFEKIYLWMDNDAAGQEGCENFAKKIGLERTYIVRPTRLNCKPLPEKTTPLVQEEEGDVKCDDGDSKSSHDANDKTVPTDNAVKESVEGDSWKPVDWVRVGDDDDADNSSSLSTAAAAAAAANTAAPAAAKQVLLPKDANDALRAGLDLDAIIADAQLVPHDRITTFADLRADVLHEIMHPDKYVGTAISSLPGLTSIIKGLRRGELTVLTGPTGSGKTTYLGQMSLDLVEQDVNVLWGSFEIKNTRLMHKLLQQFAREPLPTGDPAMENKLNALADRFEQLPFTFMKFHGSSDVDDVLDAMDYAVYVNDVEHIILDNMQFMVSLKNLGSGSTFDKFDVQDVAIEKFRKFATDRSVHVTLVVHPRKEAEFAPLSMSSIYGSAKATQEADTVLILQNNGQKKYLEVKKNRFNGALGTTSLHFDRRSCRYSETPVVGAKGGDGKGDGGGGGGGAGAGGNEPHDKKAPRASSVNPWTKMFD